MVSSILKMRTSLLIIAAITVTSLSYAQEAKTADELKAERKELQTEMKSKDALKREKKLAELDKSIKEGKQPVSSGVSSVDMLATSSTELLKTVQSSNELLSKYKRHIIDNGDGEYDVTEEKAKTGDYLQLLTTLGEASLKVAAETAKLQAIKDEIKSLAPTQAMPATKSVTYSTDALNVCGGELQVQTKLVKNLIELIKSKENL